MNVVLFFGLSAFAHIDRSTLLDPLGLHIPKLCTYMPQFFPLISCLKIGMCLIWGTEVSNLFILIKFPDKIHVKL